MYVFTLADVIVEHGRAPNSGMICFSNFVRLSLHGGGHARAEQGDEGADGGNPL